MKTYELYTGNELVIADKIQRRRLQLLIHSCLYYEMNINLISDSRWDTWARELVKLQSDNPEISKNVDWYESFKDWDASTGAFLPIKDEWVVFKASQLAWKFSSSSNKIVIEPKKKEKVKTAKLKLF